VSNYDVRAVLALQPMPERQLRVLIALATVTPETDGWRSIGAKLLAEIASLHQDTVKKAQPELVKAGLLDYEPGNGKGHYSRYRLNLPSAEDSKGGVDSSPPLPEKGRVSSSPPLSVEKGRVDSSPPSAVKGGSAPLERGGRPSDKGGDGQLADLHERDHCPKDSVLGRSVLGERSFQRDAPRSPRATIRGNKLLAEHLTSCRHRPPRDVIQRTGEKIEALVADEAGFTDDQIRAGLERMRAKNLGPWLLPDLVYEAINAPRAAGNGQRSVGRHVRYADEEYASGF
jgi:hypothetical protein